MSERHRQRRRDRGGGGVGIGRGVGIEFGRGRGDGCGRWDGCGRRDGSRSGRGVGDVVGWRRSVSVERVVRSVVLVPAYGAIDAECERKLRVLEERGYTIRTLRGNASLGLARAELATRALDDGFDVLVWIDSDMRFDPDDVDCMRAQSLPFLAAIGVKKGRRELACHVMPGTTEIAFGARGGLVEVRDVGMAFVVTRRVVYETMRDTLGLPSCNEQFGQRVVPYFIPTVVTDAGGPWYLEEDYAFCERVRASGFRVLADTRVRLWHVGSYAYSWEDAGRDVERFADYTFRLKLGRATES